ncbi:hypothetical protein DS901_02500 [Loktanella sp. D2R18]|uniref:pilus assembly FimT family protein n=1 Tax=Rhodobacterales TaxID=204455 RepID=UPI000DE98CF9|nr:MULTISPECIES: prepilin-type N-terminal cleavage/methylation domain-containing protein [Rhodobacterales]MDO6591940.1 prepilin-type N-terminal cleavage/methylation domain-containing protein [Yoonia sp. 1_MG-2023]RBW45653.1 hypothetical protein DS901_02500 [Loktanella sp. D2R18]
MSFSNDIKSNSGFSLLEVLIVLSVVALTIAALSTTRLGPSPAMALETQASQLQQTVATARAEAIRNNKQTTITLDHTLCTQSDDTLTFYPDGTANAANICLQQETLERALKLDPLTGQLVRGVGL